jgi:hypothetical protein
MADDTTTKPLNWMLGNATQYIAMASALSFGLGICVKLGEYLAVGSNIAEFIAFEDVVNASVKSAPIAFLGYGYFQFVYFGNETNKPATPKKSVRFPLISLVGLSICVVCFNIVFFLLPVEHTRLYLLIVIATIVFSSRRIRYQLNHEQITVSSALIGITFLIALLFISIAYVSTYDAFDRLSPTHTICKNDDCRAAVLLDRLAAGLVVRWSGEQAATFLPNTSFTSVTGIYRPDSRPIYDVFGLRGKEGE